MVDCKDCPDNIEPNRRLLTLPPAGQRVFKIMAAEHLISSLEESYLYFTRVDSYQDFLDADAHDGEQLPNDRPINSNVRFVKDRNISAENYYDTLRSRAYAYCLSLVETDEMWEKYGEGEKNCKRGKVCISFNFDRLRAMINSWMTDNKCILDIHYGIVEYIDRSGYKPVTGRLRNPIQYIFMKDTQYEGEKELRICLSSILPIEPDAPNLRLPFNFRNALYEGVAENIYISQNTDIDFLRNRMSRLDIDHTFLRMRR